MGKIQDYNLFYELLKKYADGVYRGMYRRFEVVGKENIPENGAVIYAPNHTSGLSDALTVLFMDGRRKVFVARADIFGNPVMTSLLRFFKLMPINRMKDGVSKMSRNARTFSIASEVLSSGVPFVIFPEGTHRDMHSLMLPLQKGVFRIAMQAMHGKDTDMNIVPVGIEYSNFSRTGGSVLVRIGKPFSVTGYAASHPEDQIPELMNGMRDVLQERMKELVLVVPDGDDYCALLDICRVVAGPDNGYMLSERQERQKNAMDRIAEMPDGQRKSLVQAGKDLHDERIRAGVGIRSVIADPSSGTVWSRAALMFLGLPVFLPAFLLMSPVLAVSAVLVSMNGDRAMDNSYRFLARALVWPFVFVAAVCAAVMNAGHVPGLTAADGEVPAAVSVIVAVMSALLAWPVPRYVYMYIREIRNIVSDMRYLRNNRLRKLSKEILTKFCETF